MNLKPSEPVQPSFIVAFNRDRDSYQVPLALAETGWLHELVTDFYASGLSSKLFPNFSHRRAAGLPSKLTSSSLLVLLIQVLGLKILKRPEATYSYIDRILGAKARKSARRSNADLLLYSRYAYEAFTDHQLQDRRRILFMFHPHRLLIKDILRRDKEAFPGIAWTIREDEPSAWSDAREDEELNRAQAIVCASSFTRRSLLTSGVSPEKIQVVPYGAPPPVHSLEGLRTGGECKFLFVGQGVQRKGLHHLLMAWNELNLSNASLTIVCYRFDPALKPLVGKNVQIVSGLSKLELENCFARSHIFVMPSLVEGFGLVFLEAMSFGCYVIASENTGVPDLALPGSVATIIHAGDIEMLSTAMQSAYTKQQRNEIAHEEIMESAKAASWSAFRVKFREAIKTCINA